MLAHLSIYPDQIFMNLLSDLAVSDLIQSSATAAGQHPELADVYLNLRDHLVSSSQSR